MKLLIAFSLLASVAHGQTPTWTQQSIANPPYYNGYQNLKFGNGKVRWFGTDNPSSIYSNSMYALTNAGVVRLGTSGSTGISPCPASTGTWPGDHHPVGQIWYDTDSDEIMMAGGICSGTSFAEMWKLSGTCTGSCTMTQMSPAHLPTTIVADKWQYSDCEYDQQNHVAVCFGYDSGPASKDLMLYCPTHGAGTLTAAQITAGCTGADDWNYISPTCSGSTCALTQPPGRDFPCLQYIGSGRFVQLFGSQGTPSDVQTAVFQYTTSTHVWLQLNDGLGTAPLGEYVQKPSACVPSSQQCYTYSYTTGHTWKFDIALATWSDLGAISGPSGDNALSEKTMTYDSTRQALVMLSQAPTGSGTSIPEIWIGRFPVAATKVLISQ